MLKTNAGGVKTRDGAPRAAGRRQRLLNLNNQRVSQLPFCRIMSSCHYLPTHEVLQHSEGLIFKLMSSRAGPNEWAEWLRAPLEYACRAGNPDLVDPLLEAGADATAPGLGEDGGTLLHAAATGGSERVVSSLLNSGAMENINAKDSKCRTPLQVAVRAGRHAAAQVLIAAGAELSSTMTEAILEGHERLAHELLLAGSDVNQAEVCYFRGTPLTFASAKGYEHLVRALLDKGADTSLTVCTFSGGRLLRKRRVAILGMFRPFFWGKIDLYKRGNLDALCRCVQKRLYGVTSVNMSRTSCQRD